MSIDDVLLDVETKMDSAVDYLKSEFRGIRTGRASAGLVDHMKVEYYGSPTDLRQIAAISTPEANLIVIKPFDNSAMKDIERAIRTSDLGINPSSDGKVIRLVIPSLSGERRQQLASQLRKMAEAARVAIRNVRRDGNKDIDKLKKDGDVTEDHVEGAKESVQELTKKYEGLVDQTLKTKTEEIQES